MKDFDDNNSIAPTLKKENSIEINLLEINQGQFNVKPEDWEKAINFFDKNKNEVKCDKKSNALERSFIKVNNKIYAIKTGDYAGGNKVKGEGAFGKVKIVQDQEGNNFAVKIEGRGIRSEQDAERNIMEILGEFHGEAERNITKEFKGKLTDRRLYTVINLKEGHELREELFVTEGNKNVAYKALTDLKKLLLAIKAAESVQHLHNQGVLHCDIKPPNFMTNVDGDTILVSVIDFGLSVKITDKTNEIHLPRASGTRPYVAPEIAFEDQKGEYRSASDPVYSKASDIYALGKMFQQDFRLNMSNEFFDGILNPDRRMRFTMSELLDKLYEKLNQQPNLSDEIKNQCKNYLDGRKKLEENFKNSINSAQNIDELSNIISNCPNEGFLKNNEKDKNIKRDTVLSGIKNISNNAGGYFLMDKRPEDINWSNYGFTDGVIKDKFIELYLKEKDMLTNILSKSKEDFHALYQEKHKSNSSNLVGKWMLNRHKDAGGFIFGKGKTREDQLNFLVECTKHIKQAGEDGNISAEVKREQALNLYSILTKIENDIDTEHNTRKSGMKEMILSQKEALKHQYPEVTTMHKSEIKERADYIIENRSSNSVAQRVKHK